MHCSAHTSARVCKDGSTRENRSFRACAFRSDCAAPSLSRSLHLRVFEMWLPILSVCLAACSLKLLVALVAQASRWRTRRRYGVAPGATTVGFFHPFCAGGGGGERVLWRAVHALSHLPKDLHGPLHVLIYTGDVGMAPEAILSGIARHFEISIDPAALPVSFVYLRRRTLLDARLYPVLTMLAQSAASVILAAEALFRGTPDVFIDTTGFAFSFPVAWFAGCSVGAYVHYPTISTVSGNRQGRERGCAEFGSGPLVSHQKY